jgi:hypothetical protein
MANPHEIVKIHIDKELKDSPKDTTGRALYELGKIDASKYDLYREVPGKGDDELIKNDATPVTVDNGDHFFSSPKKITPGA